MDLKEEQIYYQANKFWGEHVIKETLNSCLKLALELNKLQDTRTFAEEKLAEVLVACERLSLIFDPEEVEKWKEQKLKTLDIAIKKEQDIYNTAICVQPMVYKGDLK